MPFLDIFKHQQFFTVFGKSNNNQWNYERFRESCYGTNFSKLREITELTMPISHLIPFYTL